MLRSHILFVKEIKEFSLLRMVTNLWRWRNLTRELAARDFRSHYRASALGALWTIVEPIVQFALYLFAFSIMLGTRVALDPTVAPFGLFVISGLVPFWVFQEVITRASSLVRENAVMVRYVRFPLEVLLLSMIGSVLARHGVALLIVIGVSAGLGKLTVVAFPWLVVGLVMLITLALGVGLGVLVLGAYLPDTSRFVSVGTMVLFFVSPVAYPLLALLPTRYHVWAYANPFVAILAAFRAPLMSAPAPPLLALALAAGWVVTAIGLSVWLFRLRAGPIRDLA